MLGLQDQDTLSPKLRAQGTFSSWAEFFSENHKEKGAFLSRVCWGGHQAVPPYSDGEPGSCSSEQPPSAHHPAGLLLLLLDFSLLP